MSRILVENLNKKFGKDVLFNNFNLQIDSGEFLCIKGVSGSGKSTLLNILGTLDSNYQGKVSFSNLDLKSMNKREIDRFRAERIGFIFQFHFLINSITIKENIMIPSMLVKRENMRENFEHLVEELDITGILNKKPQDCSGGERQRTAIARSLINDPDIILADEPTGNLDSSNSKAVGNILRSLNRDKGKTIVLVTHNEYMSNYANRVVNLTE
ncbi:MAG TPA: lipoprotein-releasing system ATP-binding protein LolD [Fusobacteria bacterium]|nr:lipoprotein-releasing system ATP-binding protein LolD [Fusobacteriota bacterium]|tara:strand:+ start:3641 stop:4279 length:639 start_codon:yes stop_codon:yes gene_type:complete